LFLQLGRPRETFHSGGFRCKLREVEKSVSTEITINTLKKCVKLCVSGKKKRRLTSIIT